MIKKITSALLLAFILLQFYRPAKNNTLLVYDNDIRSTYIIPTEVLTLLEKSCYDCHSNHTEYPWYAQIQPVGMWLQNHINEGKDELNFSIFKTYSDKRKAKKLKEIIHEIEDGEMPLNSYLWIHKNAILSQDDKQTLIDWAKSIQS